MNEPFALLANHSHGVQVSETIIASSNYQLGECSNASGTGRSSSVVRIEGVFVSRFASFNFEK